MVAKTVVAWCSDDQWHLPADEIGKSCPGDACPRKLRKRAGYICPDAWCQKIHWRVRDLETCDHEV